MAKNLQSRLKEIINALPEKHAKQLLEFAEFLFQRHGEDRTNLAKQDITRPESESVVKAIKRLTRTYPMLEPDSLLTQTSELMSQNIVGGKPAKEVIDKLELLFQERFEDLQDTKKTEV